MRKIQIYPDLNRGNCGGRRLSMMMTDAADLDHRMDDGVVMADEVNGSAMEVPSPVVFQCSECKTIVGDSSTISSMDPINRTMTIKRKTDAIIVSAELKTSTEESDFGSTFHVFYCANCKQALGQVYRTTSSKLDYLRDLYTFHSDQLIFYQLFPEPEVYVEQQTQQQQQQSSASESVEEKPAEKIAPKAAAALQSDLEVEILKLQKFCTFLHDRMLKMEDELEQHRRSSVSSSVNGKTKKHH